MLYNEPTREWTLKKGNLFLTITKIDLTQKPIRTKNEIVIEIVHNEMVFGFPCDTFFYWTKWSFGRLRNTSRFQRLWMSRNLYENKFLRLQLLLAFKGLGLLLLYFKPNKVKYKLVFLLVLSFLSTNGSFI